MDAIFALYPFSKESKPGDNVTWHFVLFGKWFDTHRYFPRKYQTSLSVCDDNIVFMRNWGKTNTRGSMWNGEYEPDYYLKVIRLPWQRWAKNTYYLKGNKWVKKLDTQKMDNFEWREYTEKVQKERDTLNKTFSYKLDGKRVIFKVEVIGTRRLFCWHWLPQWLPLFPVDEKEIEVRFKTEGGIYNTYYPFTKNLETSWNNFYYLKLPEYLEAHKYEFIR